MGSGSHPTSGQGSYGMARGEIVHPAASEKAGISASGENHGARGHFGRSGWQMLGCKTLLRMKQNTLKRRSEIGVYL